ncbi:unnamed protein product [Periconia digitata]|uniref:FAD-binding PCMH-type domain-containing protein n=1 Tax=Periconia digitata TaxID=1303443 RepID=A0A9W4UKZ0_9PLEO|nr:unnamed protein product [Periconia digitata]
MAVIFHPDDPPSLRDLACRRRASFIGNEVRVADEVEALERFSSIVAGFSLEGGETVQIRMEWRRICREMGRVQEGKDSKSYLHFRRSDVMVAFTANCRNLLPSASIVSELEGTFIKNVQASSKYPTLIATPRTQEQIRQCVNWALENNFGLTVIGGGHSEHCIQQNILAIDMKRFNGINIIKGPYGEESTGDKFAVIKSGCKILEIVERLGKHGLTVPLGTRPSVGAGSWLQGGIGHLSRKFGLSSDHIVGAVLVELKSGRLLRVGHVSDRPVPKDKVSLSEEDEEELLWAIQGAGTNFGVVISVTMMVVEVPLFKTLDWITSSASQEEIATKIREYEDLTPTAKFAAFSADAYLFMEGDQLKLGVTLICTDQSVHASSQDVVNTMRDIFGDEKSITDQTEENLLRSATFMSTFHDGHDGGKKSAFKRSVFLNSIGSEPLITHLTEAVEAAPNDLCYIELVLGGGQISRVAPSATAFGCRNWEFACVVTGIWPRDNETSAMSERAVDWVYNVIKKLLPWSCEVYATDLGPDPRDTALAAHAFGTNGPRLARLKQKWDPLNVLAYTCPLPDLKMKPEIIFLVTGSSGVGKDYCAQVWANTFKKRGFFATVKSISAATKQEYAAAHDLDSFRLRNDREYKEQHREGLTKFYHDQVDRRPSLPGEHFVKVVREAGDVNVVFVTGLRDPAPVTSFGHLVSHSRVFEINVRAEENTTRLRRGLSREKLKSKERTPPRAHQPCFQFTNNESGEISVDSFGTTILIPLLNEEIRRLESMVRTVPDFPKQRTNFRHILDICQHPGGLSLCTKLMAKITGDLRPIVACEAGGFVFASALALHTNQRLVLIREAGKLPPPTFEVVKHPSNITSLTSKKQKHEQKQKQKKMVLEWNAIPRNPSVLIVDDVLATGRTLCAMLQLLAAAGVSAKDVAIMVVAEFPLLRGRELLRQHGFGQCYIRSLLSFDGE